MRLSRVSFDGSTFDPEEMTGRTPGPGRDDVRLGEVQVRELGLRRPQNIVELRPRDAGLAIEIVAMIDIRRADQGRSLPGNREKGTAVVGMEQSDRLRQRKAPGLEQEMAAAQRPKLRLAADFGAQAIGPRAGGIDHAAGLDLERHALDFVMEPGAVDAVRPERQRFRRRRG